MDNNLESMRVNLREVEEKDWKAVHKYASQEIVCQYQPWGPNTEIETIDFVKQILVDAGKVPRERFVFSIILKENTLMIGAVELTIRDLTNKVGEISYIVNPDYWSLGIATEVAKLITTFGFKKFNLHRIYATCDPRNIGSAKVLQKLGMTKEGRIREDVLIKDGWRDSLLYSVLEQEWDY